MTKISALMVFFHLLSGSKLILIAQSTVDDLATELSGVGFNFKLVLVMALLAIAIIMFIKNKPRMDAVGIIMKAALPFTGIISVEETLIGFSDPNIVLIAVLFVMGEGLVRTGGLELAADR